MKNKTIVCSTTSAQEILGVAKRYFDINDFEVQDIITENGDVGIQARKTSWLRKCSGTSYALQIVVSKKDGNRYVVSAGWGEWLAKGTVVLVATFIAFGFLIIPAMFGIVNQKNLPDRCLDYVTSTVVARNALCKVYDDARQ